jgi:hypothetical protein
MIARLGSTQGELLGVICAKAFVQEVNDRTPNLRGPHAMFRSYFTCRFLEVINLCGLFKSFLRIRTNFQQAASQLHE